MIKNLDKEELLDYLMTSDFNEPFKDSEYVYLLEKWRYYYRLIYSKSMVKNDGKDQKIKNLEENIEDLKREIHRHKVEKATIANEFDSFKNKKLTWIERLTGKIKRNK